MAEETIKILTDGLNSFLQVICSVPFAADFSERLFTLGSQEAVDEEVEGSIDVTAQLEDADHEVEGVVVPALDVHVAHGRKDHPKS